MYSPQNEAGVTARRVVACLIDYTTLFVFCWYYGATIGKPNESGGWTLTGLPALGPVVVWFAWMVLAEAKWGQTVGHAIVGLKIISIDGGNASFSRIFKRRLCDILEISWCFGLIAFLLVTNTPARQRLGDTVGRIIVVDKNYTPERFDFEDENAAF
jgi:uncharacterized RDD family membrane protein YckC